MKLRDLLELMRVSNLPTVWSNAVLGYFAGVIANFYHYHNDAPGLTPPNAGELLGIVADHPFRVMVMFALGVVPFSFLYSGGMILNDYVDRHIDASERPSRPIPSGRVQARTALWIASLFLALGLIGIFLFELRFSWYEHEPWRATAFGGCLLVAIVMYNLTHQHQARSVVLMGACRALIVLSVASILQPPIMIWAWWVFVALPAASLLLYTILISIVARREVAPDRLRKFGGPRTVMNMIAAMPLLDAAWLVVMGLWPASLVCVGCAVLTKLGYRKVAGS